jgi:uncharacterized phage-associated protein
MSDRVRQHPAPRVQLRVNIHKILAAISYVIAIGEKRGMDVTQYDILKTFFIADRSHLNQYGRPVTFDNYYAMRAGPVPSVTYDLLKESTSTLQRFHLHHLPWDRQAGSGAVFHYGKPDTSRIDEALSESDKLALSDALSIIKGLTFRQIVELTHNDPAYVEAWKTEDARKAYPMSLGMFFDSPDFAAAETVEFLSKHQ